MSIRTSASRFHSVVLALLALGGCAPIDGDDELLLEQSEQALITEVGFPATDGAGKEAGSARQKSFSTSNFRLVIGDLPTVPVKKVDAFRFENKAPTAGRIAPERTVEIVLEDASVDEVESLLAAEHTATLTSFDEDGNPVMDMHLLGVRLIARPRAASSGLITVKLAYDALSMGTP